MRVHMTVGIERRGAVATGRLRPIWSTHNLARTRYDDGGGSCKLLLLLLLLLLLGSCCSIWDIDYIDCLHPYVANRVPVRGQRLLPTSCPPLLRLQLERVTLCVCVHA